MTLEILEERLDRIRREFSELLAILKKKNIDHHYNEEVKAIISKYYPRLELRSRDIINLSGQYTEINGNSRRLDYIKNATFLILGYCIGEDLSESLEAEYNNKAGISTT
jgi:hypothetical protein